MICDGTGLPLAVTISPGQEHETQQVHDLLEPLIEAERLPENLAGDKAYSAGWLRELLAELGVTPVIPHIVLARNFKTPPTVPSACGTEKLSPGQ
jgi:transposase